MRGMQELIRFETKVPRQFRERLNTLARILAASQTEVIGQAIVALEASLSEADGVRYQHLLRRRWCAPEGTRGGVALSVAELPPLPFFDPPLGVKVLLVPVPPPRPKRTRAPAGPREPPDVA
jgi:hypothetical protein